VTRIGRGKKPRAVEIHQVKALKEVDILTERLRGPWRINRSCPVVDKFAKEM
jgi:hypothetical protein